jgi:8-oxo-dGTP diphosphatase
MTAPVEVAVGVLVRPDGACVLAQRPAGKPYAGWWEFPGGKIEAGETVGQALARELHEELGLDIRHARRWITLGHVYPHATVRLHFCRVFEWSGEPHGREGQAFTWLMPGIGAVEPLLPATVPVMRLLALPACYSLSAIAAVGIDAFLPRFEDALARGMRLFQLREPGIDEDTVGHWLRALQPPGTRHGATILASSRHGGVWRAADGVHLTSDALLACERRPEARWVAASVHDRAQLLRAAELGVDFAVLGPVAQTASHPGQPALGWQRFEQIAEDTPIPLFAIGGLASGDVTLALSHGAHGIAQLGGAWRA